MTDDWISLVNLAAVNTKEIRACVVQRMYTIGQANEFIDGPEVEQFEWKWADYVGARYCVLVGNGTDALELAVRARFVSTAGVIAIPAFTFVATAEAVVRAGEDLRLIDVDAVTLLASGPVDVAVGLYGQLPPDDLGVVDAAQMHGHRLPGVTAAWSFYPTKSLGAWGDAGAVTTDDQGLAEGIRVWARHGGGGRVGPGFNSRCDSLQAAVLIEKLPYLDEWVEERRQAAESYSRRLRGFGLDVIGDRKSSVFHQCVVRVPHRDAVLRLMLERRVQCGVHYPLALSEMEWLEPFRPDVAGDELDRCPVAEQAAREVLSLPLYPGMPISVIDRVVNMLGESVQLAETEAS